jgi:hypothetical protein
VTSIVAAFEGYEFVPGLLGMAYALMAGELVLRLSVSKGN